MRILILTTPRSGSTLLTNVIAKMLKTINYQEPFNFAYPNTASQLYPEELPKDVVVKTMFDQFPIGVYSSNTEFYLNEIKKYDKVILLSRLDIKASYESFNYRLKNNPNGDWHTAYYYNELKKNINLFSNFLNWTDDLIKFSMLIGIPVTWYEDVYINKDVEVVEAWDIGLNAKQFFTHIETKSKYRLDSINVSLI